MWVKQQIASEWDMAWFCDRCEKMMPWKIKGWIDPLNPSHVYCNECKEKIERSYNK